MSIYEVTHNKNYIWYKVHPGAHPGGLFGCHDWPLCTAGRLFSVKADDKISNVVTAVSDAHGLEQVTAYIFPFLMLH